MGPFERCDELVTEATSVDDKTKVSVPIKVIQRELKANHTTEWRSQWSNGRVERWLLSQIEDELGSPSPEIKPEIKVPSNETATTNLSSPQTKPDVITNKDILSMVEAKLPDSIIIAKIKKSNCNFDLSTEALITLKKNGVNDVLIAEMLQAEKK